jgi:hypothetical protein
MTQLSKSAEHHHFLVSMGIRTPMSDIESTRSSIYGLVIQGVGVVFYLAWRANAARARGAVAPAE